MKNTTRDGLEAPVCNSRSMPVKQELDIKKHEPANARPPSGKESLLSAQENLASPVCAEHQLRPWYLYMVECRDGSIYTGIALDVATRFAQHLAGKGARYTRAHPPLRIIAVVTHPHRSSALKAEHALKKLSATDKRRFAAQHPLPPE